MSSTRWRSRAGIALAAALSISLIAAVPAQADDTSATVHGVVTASDSGDPVGGAEVRVEWFGGEGSTVVTTDEAGAYEVSGIPTETGFEFEPGTELIGEVTPPDGSGLRFALFPAQLPLAAGENRQIDVTLRPFPSTTIESSSVSPGASFVVSGFHWDAGGYEIRALDADGVSLLATDSIDFSVPGHGEFSVELVTDAAAPAGDYELATSPVGEDTWTPFGSIEAKECTFLSSIPVITGTPAVGELLSVDPGDWDVEASFDLTWYANGVHIPEADSGQLELTKAQAGKKITATLTGHKTGFDDVVRTSIPTDKVITAGAATISGKAVVGTTLTALPGTWTTGTTFGYQWNHDGVAIEGATASTFTPTVANDGEWISVTITGIKSTYAEVSATSAETKRVMLPATPKITGYAAIGNTLTADAGTWSEGTTFSYQWYASGAKITGATAATYKLASATKGKTISVTVVGRNIDYTTVTKASKSTAKVATAAKPTISGTAAYRSTLTAKPGTWTTGTTFAYQWYANDVAISGATKSTLTLGTAQKGTRITVRVTGKKSGYATVPKTSAATPLVATAATPTISGTPRVTSTLTAIPGAWTDGTTFTYQWYANGAKITGATKESLKLAASVVGKTITVAVTGKSTGYATVAKTSKATAAVSYPTRTTPVSTWNCPSWAPIKGNQGSPEWIYHMPGGQSYNVTQPEECFRTEAAAVSAGYRKAKR